MMSYSGSDSPMLLPFIVDHPDPRCLEYALHLLWSGCGSKVHILWPLPCQEVTYCTPSYPQLKLVLLKKFCESYHQNSKTGGCDSVSMSTDYVIYILKPCNIVYIYNLGVLITWKIYVKELSNFTCDSIKSISK